MKEIIVYDFDKTVYGGETSTDFMKFFLKRNKKYLFRIYNIFPSIFYYFINLKKSKEYFFKILNDVDKKFLHKEIDLFWEKNSDKVFKWFYKEIEDNKKEVSEIILISATPSIFLEKFSKKLGFNKLIATEFVNKKDVFFHKIEGNNCKGYDKVKKLNEYIKDYKIIKFYSDSISDKPLFDLAEKKYAVIKGIKKEGMPND